MFKKIIVAVIFSSSLFLSGCASIVSGTNQCISVSTCPVQGAMCTLQNDKGCWYIPQTPGSVVVHRSYNDLIITVQKRGYCPVVKRICSKTKGMAFGNVVFGGVVGAGVDVASGAAYDYPTNIVIALPNKK